MNVINGYGLNYTYLILFSEYFYNYKYYNDNQQRYKKINIGLS